MKKVFYILPVLAFIILSSFLSLPKKTYLLRYQPEQGKEAELTMDYTMDISMDMMGQKMDMNQLMEMGANMKVIKSDEKESQTKFSYTYFAMTMDNPLLGTMSYDSRQEDNSGMVAMAMDSTMQELLNTELVVVSDEYGKTEISEGKQLLNNQTAGSLDMTSMLGMSSFPKKAIVIGESWEQLIKTKDSPMILNTTFTLKEVNDGKVYIDFESDVTTNEQYESGEGEEDIQLEITGEQYGTLIYEENTMWLLEGRINQDMEMLTEQMGMSIPMDLKGEMIMLIK